MRNKKLLYSLLGACAFIVVVWLVGMHVSSSDLPPSKTKEGRGDGVVASLPTGNSSTSGSSEDPRWNERNEKLKNDPYYEWRTPIDFFGKVVDEDGHPIPGVSVKLSWNDTSLSGTTTAKRITDDQGLFSVRNTKGKILIVNGLIHDDYLDARSKNRFSFEYAAFWDPEYHVPDASNPVIFNMKRLRKNPNTQTLGGALVASSGSVGQIPIFFGSESRPSFAVLRILESDPKTELWRAELSVSGGGVVLTSEEFPDEAPSDGYQEKIIIDSKSPKPINWSEFDQGGRFYVMTKDGYGLLQIQQIAGYKRLRYTYTYNKSSDRQFNTSR